MTADIELPPLPEPLPRVLVHVLHEGDMELEAVGNYYNAEQVRACVEYATAAKDAEIERLRAVRDSFQRVGIAAQDRAERLEAEVEAVWAAMPRDARYLDPPDGGCVPLHEQVRRMASDATRAERLAEALRYAEAFISVAVPQLARDRDEAVNEVLPAIRAALRDHDQEVGNG